MSTIIPQGSPYKQCVKCQQQFPATKDFFYAHKTSKDGLHPRCKSCFGKDQQKRHIPQEGHKRCGGCKQDYPATNDYFHVCETRRDGLHVYCKSCAHERQVSRYAVKKEQGPIEAPPNAKHCTKCGKGYPATPEYFIKHPTSRYGLHTTCKTCMYASIEQWGKDNPEKRHVHLQKNGQKRRAEGYFKTRYISKRDHILAQQLAFKLAHPETVRDWKHRYEQTDRGKESHTRSSEHRRARMRHVAGKFTKQDINEQLVRQKCKCYYCKSKFKTVKGRFKYHIEHTFPLSRVEGTDIPANSIDYLVLACPDCNKSKGNKYPWEWPQGGRLL